METFQEGTISEGAFLPFWDTKGFRKFVVGARVCEVFGVLFAAWWRCRRDFPIEACKEVIQRKF